MAIYVGSNRLPVRCPDVMIATQPCGSKLPWRILKSPQGSCKQGSITTGERGGWSQIGTIRTSRHKDLHYLATHPEMFSKPQKLNAEKAESEAGKRNVSAGGGKETTQAWAVQRHLPSITSPKSQKISWGDRAVGRSVVRCPNRWRPGCRVPFR